MSSKAYVVQSFGQPVLGQVEAFVGMQTQYGVVAEVDIGMFPGKCHVVSGSKGIKDSFQYTDKLFVPSGTLEAQLYPTGATCFPFGFSNFNDPRRPSGFYVGNGTNEVPKASYR